MASWIKIVEIEDLVDGTAYFLARKPISDQAPWYFYSRDIKGKNVMSTKPGIAMHCVCNEKFRAALAANPDLWAIAIPDDHAERWTRRRKRFW